MTIILGLTGGIATGKSTVAAYLESCGAWRIDADACVHELLSHDHEMIAQVARHFPDAVEGGRVNRKKLGALVFHDDAAMKQLEAILHPRVRAQEEAMIEHGRQQGASLVLLDIPLLFETDAHLRCDVTATTDCSLDAQRTRALSREGMTEDRLNAILARQLPAAQRNARADYVIDTECVWDKTRAQLDAILKEIRP